MSRARLAIVCAAALAFASPAPAQQIVNLRDADIRAFIQDASRVTGRTFIIDSAVTGKVSVVTDRPLSRAEYFEVFLATLRANGLVAVPVAGGALRIQPVATAAGSPGRVGPTRTGSTFATEIIQLRSIDARQAAETLRPLVGAGGSVSASRAGNALVIADYADNLRRLREVLARIDRDTTTTRVVPLANAGAREIAAALQELAGRGADGANVIVGAVDSANALTLRGDASTVARFAQVAAELDRRASGGGAEIRVIRLRHAEAALLVPVLQQIVGQSPAPAVADATPVAERTPAQTRAERLRQSASPTAATATAPPSRAGGAVIARYEGANAIVIAAPADLQRQLGEVIRQLDTRREQVLVEAIIVEISDNAARQLGVQFLLGGLPGSGVPFAATNYSNAAPNILTIAGAIGARELDETTTTIGNGNTVSTSTRSPARDALEAAAVQSILGAAGGFAGFAAELGRDAIFGTILQAVRSDTESNILSTPSVMTLDNQEARILVGQEIPVTTGQALSDNFDNAFRTVQRENVGIQLEVKPQINEGGAIQLFIRQEVSSIAGPVSNDNTDLILNKREIETTVTVDDGEIVALGGLLDDNERRTLERIPFLSDIPIVGELFKSRSRSRTKTNLMVFIRPTILRSVVDARRLAEQRYGYVRARQAAQRPDREPTIDELVREYLGTAPPIPPAPLPGSAAPVPTGTLPATTTTTQPVVITPSVRTTREVVRPLPAPPR